MNAGEIHRTGLDAVRFGSNNVYTAESEEEGCIEGAQSTKPRLGAHSLSLRSARAQI